MNINKRRIYTALSATMISIAAGSALSASNSSSQEPTNSAQSNAAHIQRATQIAADTLALEPGDAELFDQALRSPILFTAIPNERTFTGQLIVHSKAGKNKAATSRISPITVKESAFVNEFVITVPAGMTEGELAAILMATGDYEFVEPNWTLYPAVVPNDPQFGSSWQHTRLQSANAWDLHTGTANIIVAICDSGVDDDHPDLVDSLVLGYNAASNAEQVNGGLVDDINGHGTFVAGCAAARGNNAIGVSGVGWDFSIMPIRVTNNSNGTASGFDLLEGARWAADHGAQIVNVSFSGGTSPSNQSTGAYLKSQGALLFWAAGNDNGFVSPNRPDYVLVASTTSSDNKSGFSNFGPAVDIAAPGSSVRSTRRFGTYGNGSGTSYASPIAAGVGAMIFSVNPEFSPDDVQAILYSSVDDLGAPGRDDSFGRGRVNTHNAILAAQSYISPIITPLNESFESTDWQDLFVATTGIVETTPSPDAPDGSSVLVLNNNDIVETVTLAGRSTSGSITLAFELKAQSIEPGESLEIQYLENPETLPNTWTTLHSISGQGLTASEFVLHQIVLPNEYKWHGVQLRFVANGSDSSDVWMIDSFSIDQSVVLVAPLDDNFESGLISSLRWDDIINAQIALDNNHSVQLADEAILESHEIPLDVFGIVPAFIRFDAWTDGNQSPSDELAIEVFNIVNFWENADTILASDLTTEPQSFEINVPFSAIAIDDMRVRFLASTTSAFHIDNVYVGVDELSAGCNAADLAEPFDTLNFFDISAFLSAFSAQDSAADFNNDGVFNFFDISEFLTIFSIGCP